MSQISKPTPPNKIDPIKFLGSIENHKHIVMLYEEPELAQTIGFEFIKNGLEKGEHCIYAMTDEIEIVKKNMSDYGIDSEKFLRNNLLHIYKIPDSYDYSKDPILEAKKFWEKIMANTVPPLRIFSTFTRQIHEKSAIECQIRIEEFLDSEYETIQGTWICPYNVTNIESENQLKWIKKLVSSHESVIFVPSIGKGMAFDL